MRLIALAGQAGVGKDTLADLLCSRYGFRKYRFAAKLKLMLAALLGCPPEMLEDRKYKEAAHPILGGKTIRHALETLGTDWGRQLIGENLWVDALMHEIAEYAAGEELEGREARAVIADARFGNEYRAVRERGGLVVQIVRPGHHGIASTHESNTALLYLQPDLTIYNTQPSAAHFAVQAAQQLEAILKK